MTEVDYEDEHDEAFDEPDVAIASSAVAEAASSSAEATPEAQAASDGWTQGADGVWWYHDPTTARGGTVARTASTDGTADPAISPMRQVHEEGMSLMRIALIQADPTVGDLAGNAKRLLALVEQAAEAGAHVAVSTELGITGYPPRDLLMSPEFVQAAFDKAQGCRPAIPTLIGTPVPGTDREVAPAHGVLAVGEGLRGKVVALAPSAHLRRL